MSPSIRFSDPVFRKIRGLPQPVKDELRAITEAWAGNRIKAKKKYSPVKKEMIIDKKRITVWDFTLSNGQHLAITVDSDYSTVVAFL